MLNDEIETASRQVKTDAYQMSVGEIINMYKEGEIVINPDFQRLFRWEIGQKSKLIESLLLGIPIPSIFVFEKEDAKWELIDGLQRISTILEFLGELKDANTGEVLPPTALVATKYLPSLDKAVWQSSADIEDIPEDQQTPLSSSQQLSIKRSRISVEILKRPSDNATKYDLFQRLNAGGTAANPQELRNCITIMVNPKYAKLLKVLADKEEFRTVLSATDDQIEKQRHMEYVSRFMVGVFIPYDGKLDVEEYVDEGMIRLAKEADEKSAKDTFTQTFKLLNETFGENALRRIQDGEHTGRVGLAAFECLAIGIAKNLNRINKKKDPAAFVRRKIEKFWNDPSINQFFTPGLRGTTRIQKTISFGEKWFAR